MLPKDTLLAASHVLGAVHTLPKPFTAVQLTACVAQILGDAQGGMGRPLPEPS